MTRYRVTDECPWGTVTVHRTDDVVVAQHVATEVPTRSIYDEAEGCWLWRPFSLTLDEERPGA